MVDEIPSTDLPSCKCSQPSARGDLPAPEDTAAEIPFRTAAQEAGGFCEEGAWDRPGEGQQGFGVSRHVDFSPADTKPCALSSSTWCKRPGEVSERNRQKGSGMGFSLPTPSPSHNNQRRGSWHSVFSVQMAPTDRRNEILRLIHQSIPKTSGLQIKKLKMVLSTQYGVDLEMVSQDLGYKDALGFLLEAPNIHLSDPARKDKCVVRIKKGFTGSELQDTVPQGPAVIRPFQATPAQTLPNTTSASLHDAVLTLVHEILYKSSGFQLEKLKQVLLTQHRVDLEMVSRYMGYKDALSFVQQAPNIKLLNLNKGGKSLVVLQKGVKPQPNICTSLPDPYPKEGRVILPPYCKAESRMKETTNLLTVVPASHSGDMSNIIRFSTTNKSPGAMPHPTQNVRSLICTATWSSPVTHPNQDLIAKNTQVNDCGVARLPHATLNRVQLPVMNPVGETRQSTPLLPLSGVQFFSPPPQNRLTLPSQNSHATKPEEMEGWTDGLQRMMISGEESMPTKPAVAQPKERHPRYDPRKASHQQDAREGGSPNLSAENPAAGDGAFKASLPQRLQQPEQNWTTVGSGRICPIRRRHPPAKLLTTQNSVASLERSDAPAKRPSDDPKQRSESLLSSCMEKDTMQKGLKKEGHALPHRSASGTTPCADQPKDEYRRSC